MLLIGTTLYRSDGDAERRQHTAAASLRALKGVASVNLQFEDRHEFAEDSALETMAVLRKDSVQVAGVPGKRRPVLNEIFCALAKGAERRGCKTFAYVNSDILVSQAAVDRVVAGQHELCLFSREDFDQKGQPVGIEIHGVDFFASDVRWWKLHARRFRPYIIASFCWDPVYAAVMLCHGQGILLNREEYIRHEKHPASSPSSPSAAFNGYLCALDRLYFSIWCTYIHRLKEMRARGANEAEELALQREIFRWPPPFSERVIQAGRSLKARVRHLLKKPHPASSA